MGWLRSKVGTALRESGVIRPVVEEFTAAQLQQLHRVVQDEVRALVPAPPPDPAADPAATDPAATDRGFLDLYASAAPSAQLAVDVFPDEWSSALPDDLHVSAGQVPLFTDSRVEGVIGWLGDDVRGARVLELGPLEGGHTYMLDRAGAEVLAIESNSRGFLKCLIVKELLSLQRARFARGDFVAYLRENDVRYDLVLASGVLYHMIDPVELLTLMGGVSDRLAIWTHYFDRDLVAGSPIAPHFGGDPEPVRAGEATYLLHPRQYGAAVGWGGFCGGSRPYARWMERPDILDCLARLGFTDIEITHDQPDHPNGPSFMLLARR